MAIKKDWRIISNKEAKKTPKEIPKKSSRVWDPYHLIWPKEEWYPLWEWEIIEDNNWVYKARIVCRFEWRRWEIKIITI